MVAFFSGYSPAQTADPASRPSGDIVYQSPAHSRGNTRVDGGIVRGPANDLPALYILAPNDDGHTLAEQPRVFWYLSRPTNAPLVLTLMPDDPNAKDPLLEINLDATKSGIQSFDLAQSHVKLEPGVGYQICLALKPEKNHGATDVFRSAEIERVEAPYSLVAQMLATPDPMEKARLLARNGMFYDALKLVTSQIEANANDRTWREQRASLLDQVGLAEVADFDRAAVPDVHLSMAP